MAKKESEIIYKMMKKKDKELLADQFNCHLKIIHHDESFFDLPQAYYEEDADLYYIWTEHCGFFWLRKPDIEAFSVERYNRGTIEEEKI